MGNSTSGGLDPAAEIHAAQGRTILVHVKDWNPTNPSERKLGAGGVKLASSFAALQEIGYNDFVIVELPPDPANQNAVRAIRCNI